MKCLSICQPFADLLLLPDSDPRHKRVENRDWRRNDLLGPLLIHASRTRTWINPDPQRPGFDTWGFEIEAFTFGAIIGMVEVVDFLDWRHVSQRHPHLAGHQHIEGAFCIVIENPRRFATPIPYRGMVMPFEVDVDALTVSMLEVAHG